MNGLADDALVRAVVGFARISGCFLVLPGLSSVRVPQQVRIVFVLALTAALMPLLPPLEVSGATRSPWHFMRLLFSESVTGVLIGIGARFYLLSVSFMMNAASTAVGISAQLVPSVMDNDMEPALSSLVSSAAVLALFSMDFHHHAIRALVLSFKLAPAGGLPDFSVISENLVSYLSDCFLVTFSLASPFLAYALLTNIFIALLNKLIPNLPLYFVATPAVLLGALLLFYVLMPALISLSAQGYFEMPL